MDKIAKSVKYKVLIKSEGVYYDVGKIIIRTYLGEVFYIPSTKYIKNIAGENKEIDHVSWHRNGEVHIKFKNEKTNRYKTVQSDSERQKISEIGYQDFIKDIIRDYRNLSQYKKLVTDLDVVFEVGNYVGVVYFKFSMVSGILIVAKSRGLSAPIKAAKVGDNNDLIASTIRALGYHSGSGDVILQYSLRKADGAALQNGGERGIIIVYDMKISKLEMKEEIARIDRPKEIF